MKTKKNMCAVIGYILKATYIQNNNRRTHVAIISLIALKQHKLQAQFCCHKLQFSICSAAFIQAGDQLLSIWVFMTEVGGEIGVFYVFSRCPATCSSSLWAVTAVRNRRGGRWKTVGRSKKADSKQWGGGMEDDLWKGGNTAVNHSYTQPVLTKKASHVRGIIKTHRQSAVIKSVILSPPIRQTRVEVETRGNSTFESLLSQTPFSPILEKFNYLWEKSSCFFPASSGV